MRQQFKSLNDRFAFGKHKGEMLRRVMASDFEYVNWAEQERIITLSDSIERTDTCKVYRRNVFDIPAIRQMDSIFASYLS